MDKPFRVGEWVYWDRQRSGMSPTVEGGEVIASDPEGLTAVWSNGGVAFVETRALFRAGERSERKGK